MIYVGSVTSTSQCPDSFLVYGLCRLDSSVHPCACVADSLLSTVWMKIGKVCGFGLRAMSADLNFEERVIYCSRVSRGDRWTGVTDRSGAPRGA